MITKDRISVSAVKYFDSPTVENARAGVTIINSDKESQVLWPSQVSIDVRAIPGLIRQLAIAHRQWRRTHKGT